MRRPAAPLALALAATLAAPAPAAASSELDLFALDDVLKQETAVASRKVRTVRETPGVVTLLGRDEILASGARDLADVLALVPGFQAASDVNGVVGAGFRGVWGNEGKVLLLVDGFEMNELLFGSIQLGRELPLDHVKAIEVVRGPGSAMYGGFAELAVVNVVTLGAEDLRGARVTTGAGLVRGGVVERGASLAAGGDASGVAWSAKAALAGGARSGARYSDFSGGGYDMGVDSGLGLGHANVAAGWRGLELRVLHNDYRLESRDGTTDVFPIADDQRFVSTFAAVRGSWRLGERVTVAPRLEWKRTTPWNVTDASSDGYYDKTADRFLAKLVATWEPVDALSFAAGAEGYADEARLNAAPSGAMADFGGRRTVTFQNAAGWAEAGWDSPAGNFLAGARAERHSAFGNSFVPRLAWTRRFEPFHLKLLYAHAFRAPVIENLALSPDVKPERTRAIEAEAGWRVTESLFATVNAFDTSIERVIVFGTDLETDASLYANHPRTGTRGVELEVRGTRPWGSASVGWSYYRAHHNEVPDYVAPGSATRLLGFASHKLTAAGSLRLAKDVVLAPSLVWLSARPVYVGLDADGALVPGELRPALYANLFLTHRNLFVRGLELGAGVHDLLDEGTSYPQPYAGGHAALPGPGRAVQVRLSFERGF